MTQHQGKMLDHRVHRNVTTMFFEGGPLAGKAEDVWSENFPGRLNVPVPSPVEFVPDHKDVRLFNGCFDLYEIDQRLTFSDCGCSYAVMKYRGRYVG